MKQLASIFKLSKEEQRPALWIGLYLLLLESMAVYYGWQRFGDVTTGIHSLLIGRFHVSGFDAWTYEIMTEWSPAYDIRSSLSSSIRAIGSTKGCCGSSEATSVCC